MVYGIKFRTKKHKESHMSCLFDDIIDFEYENCVYYQYQNCDDPETNCGNGDAKCNQAVSKHNDLVEYMRETSNPVVDAYHALQRLTDKGW